MRSKTSSSPSKPNSFVEQHFPAFSPESILPRLQPPEAPKFPSLSELATSQPTASPALPSVAQTPGPRRLYEALVNDPLTLYHSYLNDPEGFEEGTAELAQQLMTGRRSYEDLDEAEKGLLDRAAVQLAHAKSPRQREVVKAQRAPSEALRAAYGELDEEDEIPIPDVPVASFWWRQ